MTRYIVAISDINGRRLQTEDDEGPAREWIWRTLKHLQSTWPARMAFRVVVEHFAPLDDPDVPKM